MKMADVQSPSMITGAVSSAPLEETSTNGILSSITNALSIMALCYLVLPVHCLVGIQWFQFAILGPVHRFFRRIRSKVPKMFNVFASDDLKAAIPYSETDKLALRIMRFGFPGLDNIRIKKIFVLSYDMRSCSSRWVMEHLTLDSVKKKFGQYVSHKDSVFFEDFSIDECFRSTDQDYLGSGFVQGHLAAAENHKSSQEDFNETYIYSNMAPQVKGFNSGAWSKLEKHAFNKVNKFENVYICTGPLYIPRMEADGNNYIKYRVIGPNGVSVPTHFFKVLVCEDKDGRFEMEAYEMPNDVIDDSVPLKSFFVPIDKIEKDSGLVLFKELPKDRLYQINGQELPLIVLSDVM